MQGTLQRIRCVTSLIKPQLRDLIKAPMKRLPYLNNKNHPLPCPHDLVKFKRQPIQTQGPSILHGAKSCKKFLLQEVMIQPVLHLQGMKLEASSSQSHPLRPSTFTIVATSLIACQTNRSMNKRNQINNLSQVQIIYHRYKQHSKHQIFTSISPTTPHKSMCPSQARISSISGVFWTSHPMKSSNSSLSHTPAYNISDAQL